MPVTPVGEKAIGGENCFHTHRLSCDKVMCELDAPTGKTHPASQSLTLPKETLLGSRICLFVQHCAP